MNRLAGIVVAVIGFIIAVLSVLKIIPGLTSPGVIMILLGALIIGLSFVNKPDPEGAERMSTPETLLNIFVSPTEVFANLRRHPRWLVAVLIMSILAAVFSNLFLYRLGAERVANFAIDKTLEMPMIQNNDQARQGVEAGRSQAIADAKNPVVRTGQAVSSFAGSVFLMAFLALIFFLFALAMGGKMNYWQAFAATVYAMFPLAVIRFVLNTVILFIKDPTEIHPITGQSNLIQDNLNFLFTPADHPVLYTIAGMFGLLWFYWIWLNATGLNNTGEKVSPTIGWTATLTVYALMIILASIAAMMFPSFIS
ncbi:MAG TPA: YIP1 family protein [Pyrinomonadaceae bacterium]|nr:YIP1 family protein [Pyrinomonadaceae bacterium]